MASSAHPAVKRTYGSKRSTPLSSSPHPASRPSLSTASSHAWADMLDSDSDNEPDWMASTKPISSTASTSAAKPGLKRTRSQLCSSPSVGPSQHEQQSSSLPPSSPPPASAAHSSNTPSTRRSPRSQQLVVDLGEAEPKRSRKASSPPRRTAPAKDIKGKAKAGQVNLLSFFAPKSPRRRHTASDDCDQPSPTKRASSPAQPAPAAKKTAQPKAALTQLYLDPFETAGHSTMSCAECSLTYARTPEDMAVHAKHHAKVISGCEWLPTSAPGKGVTVLGDGIEWKGAKGTAKLVMVDADVQGLTGRRLRDILDTVDTSLSATGLSQEQLAESKAFLFVTAQRKVLACALVQRIQHAFRVIDAPSEEQTASASPVMSPSTGASKANERLLQFGDTHDDEGAIFCDPTPLPTLLGVHRIWTSPSHRRAGLATLLLNAVAQSFIYGCPISRAQRGAQVAFSQPTGKGQALARMWTGGGELRVFVD